MALVASSTRRRRWAVIAAAAAVLGVGYCSYTLYTSEAWRRRRQQVARLVATLSLLGDTAQECAESAALISADLKRFLLSDDDELPRSLRQALKIAHSPDLQYSCTLLSAALTRGLLRGFASSPPPPLTPLNRNRSSNPPEDPSCKEIKEICLISCSDSPGLQKRGVHYIEESERDQQEWELKSYTSGPPRRVDTEGRRQQQRGSKQSEELPERLLGKLFSEPGVNFASAVVGNLACNIVKAIFDGFESQNVSQTNGDKLDSGAAANEETAAGSKVVEVLCTQKCRRLIVECIQTLVTTTVSVYVEKTKDVNFYDDMVAGITNPSHKDPMKDLLTTVCNGAIETLVKTSHNVMFAKKSGQLGSDVGQEQWAVEELTDKPPALSISRSMQCQGTIQNVDAHICASSHGIEVCDMSAPVTIKRGTEVISQDSEMKAFGEKPQRNNNGVQSFIDGVSKTLAIPSNHKLVVDVAGTMTSEAVRSFVDVIFSTVSSNLHDKLRRGWGIVKRGGASEEQGDNQALQCQTKYKETAIKAFILASICLAICLHMLTGVHVMENV